MPKVCATPRRPVQDTCDRNRLDRMRCVLGHDYYRSTLLTIVPL